MTSRKRRFRNLGPVSESMLERAGIRSLADLRRLGAVRSYSRVAELWSGASLNLLWGIYGAIHDMDWRDIPSEVKNDLRAKLELEPRRKEKRIREARRTK